MTMFVRGAFQGSPTRMGARQVGPAAPVAVNHHVVQSHVVVFVRRMLRHLKELLQWRIATHPGEDPCNCSQLQWKTGSLRVPTVTSFTNLKSTTDASPGYCYGQDYRFFAMMSLEGQTTPTGPDTKVIAYGHKRGDRGCGS